jgi:hypothetical protein
MASFDLTVQTRVSLPRFGEPFEFITEYTGVIRKYSDDSDSSVPIGKLKALYLHVGLAIDASMSLYDICDDHSEELHGLHTRFFEADSYELRESISEQFDVMACDVLVLDYVALHPKWRGLKLGLLAVRRIIDLLAQGCGLVVSEVLPLAPHAPRLVKIPQSWVPIHKTEEDLRAGTKKLRHYFRQVGFERVGRSPYYALSVAKLATPAQDLLKMR